MSRQPIQLEEHLTIDQLAERLHVSYMTARSWLKSGRIRYRKIGRMVRVPASAVVAFLERQSIGGDV